MNTNEWVASLQPGDRVCIVFTRGGLRIGTVDRKTPSGIVVVKAGSSEHRFNSDGRLRGASAYYQAHLTQITPEILDRLERSRLLSLLVRTNWGALPTETLCQIHDKLKEVARETGGPDAQG